MRSLTSATASEIRQSMLDLLPDDGTPILNRVMRLMLARRLERQIDQETFFEARDQLLAENKIGRLRGQGGQMFLTQPAVSDPLKKNIEKDMWPESALMEPLRLFLEGPFKQSLDLPTTSACIVKDTSTLGPAKGKWARPDFIVVSAMRFRIMPGAQVDLHSFELKTEAGGSVLAIHEALAQTRFTHFGHFVWHLPEGSKFEALLDDISIHCEEHGIGLIRMRDPHRAGEADGCEILVDPARKPTLPAIVDGFLEARLDSGQKAEIAAAIGPVS